MRSDGAALAILIAAVAGGAPRLARPEPVATVVVEPPASAAPPGDPAYLDVVVNLVPGETSLVYLAPDGDAWVPLEQLTRSLRIEDRGVRRTVEGGTFVSLRSLAPDLAFEADDASLAVRVTAGPALTGAHRLDLGRGRGARGPLTPATSAFVNYSAESDLDGDVSAAAELGVSRSTALLLTSVTRAPDARIVRGLSTLTYERPEKLVRFLVGDAVASGGALGGGAILLGLGASRDLSLDPYLVTTPLPDARGFALTPSRLEVWVNGMLVREVQVQPGSYELENIPVTSGTNEVRTVLRDAFGRTQVVDATQYLANGLLARGQRDWSVQAGVAREAFGTESFSYGATPMLFARYRGGLTDRVTAATRFEGSADGLVSGGGSLLLGTKIGELETSLAGSVEEGEAGAAGLLAWRWTATQFWTTAHLRLISPRYANASLAPAQGRDLWRAGVSLSAPARWGSVGIDYVAAHPRSGGTTEQGSVRATMWMSQGAAVTFAATGGRGPDAQWTLGGYTSVTFGLGPRTHGSTTAASDRTGMSAMASVHRSLPVGTGVGYWIQGSATEERSSGSGQLLAHTDFGRYEAYLERSPAGGEGGRVSASGAIVGIGRKLFFTRPLTEGFALLRVPGVAGVRAYRESQAIGRTDADGDVLVPNLLPYYGNRLSIADRDVPEAYLVRETRRSVTVPTRGGALALFDVAPLNAVTGILNVPGPGEAQVPAYGTLAVELVDRRLESPIGTDGRFWLESVPAGHHPAEITWGGGRCGFTFSVPDGAFDVLDVGTIGCAVRE